MAIRQPKVKRGDRVEYDGHACAVLGVKGDKLTIRDKYGFPVEVRRKEVKPAS